MTDEIQARKADHLHMATDDRAETVRSAGFDDVHLVHDAVPELDLAAIDTSIDFLGRRLALPLVISAMTGGHAEGGRVNAILARAAERFGIAMGVGSQRAALVDPALRATYAVTRTEAPAAFLIANVGAAQLIAQGEADPLGTSDVDGLIDAIRADALAIHLNPLQELVQPEGDRNTRGMLDAMRALVGAVDVPVIAKETGGGMSDGAARRLAATGAAAIDVGGVGGTSFVAIEAMRAEKRGDERGVRLGRLLRDWGIPTVASVVLARSAGVPIVATGGVRSGLDAAKAIAMGATAVGVARPLLQAAIAGGDEAVASWIDEFAEGLVAAMFLTGSPDVETLRRRPTVVVGGTEAWLRQLGINDIRTMGGER
jgi:isopentenyl-diphosphate delta-isomerase